jgi:hypothetical protein
LKQGNWYVKKVEIWKCAKKGTLPKAKGGTKVEMGDKWKRREVKRKRV